MQDLELTHDSLREKGHIAVAALSAYSVRTDLPPALVLGYGSTPAGQMTQAVATLAETFEVAKQKLG